MTMMHTPPMDGEQIAVVESGPAAIITGASEVEAQLAAAHRYRRSITSFLREATTLATMTQDVAASCIYSLPRAGKALTGPSVRLAELVASAYGNLQIGARIVETTATEIVAQGAAWDVERNVRIVVEARRRITGRDGQRFSDDMITVTGNAAASIALRNAIFRVVPRSYVDHVYHAARSVAVGDARTLDARRTDILDRLGKLGVPRDRVLARLGRHGVDDVGLEDLEFLVGLGTAIKSGDTSIDEAFPPVAAIPDAPDGVRVKLPGRRAPAAQPDAAPVVEEVKS